MQLLYFCVNYVAIDSPPVQFSKDNVYCSHCNRRTSYSPREVRSAIMFLSRSQIPTPSTPSTTTHTPQTPSTYWSTCSSPPRPSASSTSSTASCSPSSTSSSLSSTRSPVRRTPYGRSTSTVCSTGRRRRAALRCMRSSSASWARQWYGSYCFCCL